MNNNSFNLIKTTSTSFYQINLLEQLDSSLFINLLRYLIAANSIGTNTFILYLFIRFYRFRSLRSTQCNLFIAANAGVELIIGLGTALRGSFQFYVLINSITKFSHSLCVWIGSPLTGGFAANQITILVLALDRLAAVATPLKYGHKNKLLVFGSLFLTIAIFIGAIWLSLWGIDDSQSSSTQCSMGINAGPLFSVVWSFFAQCSTLLVFG
ncbi:G_PROTEIN_RECEP_F1_2 domain-containing protein [Meloidogyne graminicola]|uniref:G_PROTEIN_RECEP_F1_2 domain-containing protein n=1 Tax=Meloidogyne graminicola TaxID=189291 RepID=A0A8S9ZB92_9BILA|nr:G_PROTEIN_RECEP_F1_2 domain-containing protein [Meloidogyne graminicola]